MNLLELVKFLRTSILDDTGGFGVQWEDITDDDNANQILRWSNEELTTYINEAIRQVYRRIQPVQDIDTFKLYAKIGIPTYQLDSRIIEITQIRSESTGQVLIPTDIQDFISDNDFNNSVGTPLKYIPNYQTNSIRIFPIPIANDTYQVIARRFPLTELNWLRNHETPEVRLEYHIPLLNYAAGLAYLKDDANTFDPQRSLVFMKLFTDEFSDTSAYSETRKRRSTDRKVKYGGIPSTSFGSNSRSGI